MKLDAFIPPDTPLSKIPAYAKAVEDIGFEGLWMAETKHNPFLASALVANHTTSLEFGTAIAVGFARSPAVMAHTAWDLAEASNGRFILGLGTQVKAHIERRFGLSWPASVVEKQREQIQAIRAFWHHWQTGEKLNHRGEYYKLSLSSPFFTPRPLKHPFPPIYIAGVNVGLAKLAGECADGFLAHPFHTIEYLSAVLIPQIKKSAEKHQRSLTDISMVINAFVITTGKERESVREQISFYASTPSYRKVLAHHGWEGIGEQLSALASRNKWHEMPALISDEMLGKIATIASPENIADKLKEKYHGVGNRITLYKPFIPEVNQEFWRQLRNGFV
jgi:probable F420-dependent oxidoreductase